MAPDNGSFPHHMVADIDQTDTKYPRHIHYVLDSQLDIVRGHYNIRLAHNLRYFHTQAMSHTVQTLGRKRFGSGRPSHNYILDLEGHNYLDTVVDTPLEKKSLPRWLADLPQAFGKVH